MIGKQQSDKPDRNVKLLRLDVKYHNVERIMLLLQSDIKWPSDVIAYSIVGVLNASRSYNETGHTDDFALADYMFSKLGECLKIELEGPLSYRVLLGVQTDYSMMKLLNEYWKPTCASIYDVLRRLKGKAGNANGYMIWRPVKILIECLDTSIRNELKEMATHGNDKWLLDVLKSGV